MLFSKMKRGKTLHSLLKLNIHRIWNQNATILKCCHENNLENCYKLTKIKVWKAIVATVPFNGEAISKHASYNIERGIKEK